MKFILLILLWASNANADLVKGLEIANKMDRASSGYLGESSLMTLVLIDARGTKIKRVMIGNSLESKDSDKTLMIFQKPADVKGTKLLTWSNKDSEDNQWLYLPSLKRVKRINSRTRGGSFMGSEFSFEDLSGQKINKYTFDLLGTKSIAGEEVWILERKSKKKSSYNKVVIYVSKKTLVTIKSEYFNKRDELFKIADLSDIRAFKVNKKDIYRANKIIMRNLQSGKKSVFLWDQRKLGMAIAPRQFTKNSLK